MTEERAHYNAGCNTEAARAATWTKTLPKKTGWYWYRGDYDAASANVQPVVIYVQVPGRGVDYPIAWQPFMDYESPLSEGSLPGEWLGPIQPTV